MWREQITTLITKSIKEELSNIEDYSKIYYKIRVADKFTEGGVFNASDNTPNLKYVMKYVDSLEFFKIYNEALLTDERFNNIEIHFDKVLNATAAFTWDQGAYDRDVAGNKKLKKKEIIQCLTEFEIPYLSPVHHGYPAWPGGDRYLQLYQVDENTQIVITKGLSDGTDHPYEIYIQTDDQTDAENFSSSWQANLVYEIGKIIPNINDLPERMKINTFLSIQIEIDGAPPEWSFDDPNGNIGLFLGLDNTLKNEFAKSFIPLNLKLMRPEELIYSIEKGNSARLQLAQLYLQQGNPTNSNLERESVV